MDDSTSEPEPSRGTSARGSWSVGMLPRRFAALRASDVMAEIGAVTIGAVVLALIMTWPLARHLRTLVPEGGTDPALNAWTLAWGADRVAHGWRGVWTPPAFYPYQQTLAYSEPLLGVSLLVAPLVWVGAPLTLVYNTAFLLGLIVSGVGMYLLARLVTADRLAAALGAAAFVCLPYRVAQAGHLQVQWLGWLPLALWALITVVQRRSTVAAWLFVAASVLQLLSYGYMAYPWALATTLTLLALLMRAEAAPALRRGLAAAAIVLAAIVPVWMVYGRVWGSRDVPTGEILENAADLGTYLAVPAAVPHAAWLPGVAQPEGCFFPGLVVTALAILGLSPWPRCGDANAWRYRLLFVAMAVLAIWVSLGPEPRAWGEPLPIPSLHRALTSLPLFEVFRVPARFGALALLAACVLAAMGAAAALRPLAGRPRMAAAAVLLALIVWEGRPATRALGEAVPQFPETEREAYEWLASQLEGAVLELPIGGPARYNFGLQDQHAALRHRHPVVNGISRVETPLQHLLGGSASPLAVPGQRAALLPLLQGLQVRHVVVRPSRYRDATVGRETLAELSDSALVSHTRAFGDMSLLTLSAPEALPTPAGHAVPSADIVLRASHAPTRIGLAMDGLHETRWLSARPQTGDESVTLEFDRPRRITGISITTSDRSLRDYPRRLTATVDDATGSRVVFDGPVLEALGRAILQDPTLPRLTLAFAPVETSRLVLRQTGRDARWYWSIDELTVWER